jgi:uncharacterized protein DUF6101
MELGGITAGSSRSARLDPLALPVRFAANDATADGCQRHIELDRERVVVRRAVHGMRVALNVPLTAFLGVALHLVPFHGGAAARITVSLAHRDPALFVPLFDAVDDADVVAEWQLWGRVLGLPLLLGERDGSLHEPYVRLGGVRLNKAAPRRRRRSAIRARRPRFLTRRKQGRAPGRALVYRGEREIIARS